METNGYVARRAGASLVPYSFSRKALRANDVAFDIMFNGMCHFDIHQINEDWGPSFLPMVPGHEIVDVVTAVGSSTSKLKADACIGVGTFIESCRTCGCCPSGEEQYRVTGDTPTYNGLERDGTTVIRIHTNPLVAAPDSQS
jgi:uncharacterized zinc-type alcohol dehydrogenase-like protein